MSKSIKTIYLIICIGSFFVGCAPSTTQNSALHEPFEGYLFTYFTGNRKAEEAIRFATSSDALKFTALNNNQPVISSADISETGGVRDPHILRGADGKTFYMVVTDMVSANGWSSNRGIVLLKSMDLINWSSSKVNFQKRFPGNEDLLRVWAPQTIYDTRAKKYMVYFSLKNGDNPDKIYYAYANPDFTDLETAPKQLFFHPENKSCIDGDIVAFNGQFHLFFKTEGHGNGIKKAVSNNLTSGYKMSDKYYQQTANAVEGSGVFKLNNSNEWILMYDVYTNGHYEFTKSQDLENFQKIEGVSTDFHPRHGTVISITKNELNRLQSHFPTVSAVPSGPRKMGQTGNPALAGFYADPDIIYSKKFRKFYLYPTSDGFDGWSGTYFKTFSSDNLVDWKDEGRILDLPKDVPWGPRNAWAPTAIEKYVEGTYKYYYYFTAAQKIGVAISDQPTGPFKDIGNPLIEKKPEGVRGGQEIDPAVFEDPKTGKSFLYWGNGYMAVAELNDNMVSLKEGTTKVITPDRTFREGTFVIYRKGIYYFFWSENDTRSPDYRVRYGTATSPVGPINVPAENLVLEKNMNDGIYGTGHNSVIQVPGRDEWYIVYHRFNYPNGIKLGDAAGFNREVCIDKLAFNADGSIQTIRPTHIGIQPVKPVQ